MMEKILEKLSPEAQQGIIELVTIDNPCVDKELLGDFLRSFDAPRGKAGLPKYKPEDFSIIKGPVFRLNNQYYHIVFNTDEGKEVVRQLEEDPRINSLKGQMLELGSGGRGFDVTIFAQGSEY